MKHEINFKRMSSSRVVTFALTTEGFHGLFNISFTNESKKTDHCIQLKYTNKSCCFAGLDDQGNWSNSFQIEYVTDAMIWLERHTDYVLDCLRVEIGFYINL